MLLGFLAVLLHFGQAVGVRRQETSCWVSIACNLELVDPSLYDSGGRVKRCSIRASTLLDAKRQCESNQMCGGITRDAGMLCKGQRLPYELRSAALDVTTSSPGSSTGSLHRCSRRYLASGRWRAIKSWRFHRRRTPHGASHHEWCSAMQALDMSELSSLAHSPGKVRSTLLNNGSITTARAKPKAPWMVPALHELLGNGIVLEVVCLAGNASSQGKPPFALIHQRVPKAWRGTRRWAVGHLDADTLSGQALLANASQLCSGTLFANLSSHWCIVLDDIWTVLGCSAAEALQVLARSCWHGLILSPTLAEVLSKLEAAHRLPGGWNTPEPLDARQHPDAAQSVPIVVRRAVSHAPLPPPPRRVFAPDVVAARNMLRVLTSRHGPLPTLVHRTRVELTIALAQLAMAMGLEGDFVETGVWKGGTTIALLHAIELARHRNATHGGRRLFACDSFRGLPERHQQDNGCQRERLLENDPGLAGCSVEYSQGALASPRSEFEGNVVRFGLAGSSLQVVEGWFNESLPPEGLSQASFLRLDGDLYTSTRDALQSLYPKLRWGGLVYVDDYGSYPGCAKAVDDYFATHGVDAPLRPIRQWDRTRGVLGGFEAVWWMKMALCCGYASCAWCA